MVITTNATTRTRRSENGRVYQATTRRIGTTIVTRSTTPQRTARNRMKSSQCGCPHNIFERPILLSMTMLKKYIAIVTFSISVILYMSLVSSKFRLEEHYSYDNNVKLTFAVSTKMKTSFSSSAYAGSKKPLLPTLCSYRPKATNCPLWPYYKNACSKDAEKRF
jgi:hypothetical protein